MPDIWFSRTPRWHPTRSRDPAGILFTVTWSSSRRMAGTRVDVLVTLHGPHRPEEPRRQVQVRQRVVVPRGPEDPIPVPLFVPLESLAVLRRRRVLARVELVVRGRVRVGHALEVRLPDLLDRPRGADPCPGACQVCGMSLERAVVHCPRCDSPHHRECWEYLGGCAIYACSASRLT